MHNLHTLKGDVLVAFSLCLMHLIYFSKLQYHLLFLSYQLLVQSQQQKHQDNVLKVNNKDTDC